MPNLLPEKCSQQSAYQMPRTWARAPSWRERHELEQRNTERSVFFGSG